MVKSRDIIPKSCDSIMKSHDVKILLQHSCYIIVKSHDIIGKSCDSIMKSHDVKILLM